MTLIVKRMSGSKNFGIFTPEGELVEGGFFELSAAVEAKDAWELEILKDEVEIAERKAGWDPNP